MYRKFYDIVPVTTAMCGSIEAITVTKKQTRKKAVCRKTNQFDNGFRSGGNWTIIQQYN